MFTLTKILTRTATITSLLTIGSFLSIDAAQAFSITYDNGNTTDGNLGFETGSFNNGSSDPVWNSTGDAGVGVTYKSVAPNDGNYQGIITTACSSNATAECVDSSGNTTSRKDDQPTAAGTYNFSGNEPVSASVETPALQDFLDLNADTLQIPRENGTISGTRTPKEGSAIKQTFTTDGAFTLSFDWNFLTNDGQSNTFGNQDFGFVTIYQDGSDLGDRQITVLDDSSSSSNIASNPNSGEYLTEGTYEAYTFSQTFPAGTYTLGYGVVDVDGVDRSSALLVDNISMQEQVPFDFSPSAGLTLVAGMFGWNRLRRRFKQDNSNTI